jgi:hypothetical protein
MPQSHITDDNDSGARPRVVLTRHARANLELRSISVSAVEQALRKGTVVHIDDKTGRFIYTLDDRLGGIRVVAEKEGDSIIVITAIRTEEFSDHAG